MPFKYIPCAERNKKDAFNKLKQIYEREVRRCDGFDLSSPLHSRNIGVLHGLELAFAAWGWDVERYCLCGQKAVEGQYCQDCADDIKSRPEDFKSRPEDFKSEPI